MSIKIEATNANGGRVAIHAEDNLENLVKLYSSISCSVANTLERAGLPESIAREITVSAAIVGTDGETVNAESSIAIVLRKGCHHDREHNSQSN